MKGLHCYIYKAKYGDCSNGGISSKVKDVTLLTDKEGLNLPFEPCDDAPAVVIKVRCIGGERYVHAEPLEPITSPMHGGTFIFASDSRFKEITGCNYPIPLHDRTEW